MSVITTFALYVLLIVRAANGGTLEARATSDSAHTTYPLPAEVVHEFPVGTWIENLAVRSNGLILATDVTNPRIYQVDPSNDTQDAVLVHEFSNTASILGIIETSPDVFYVCSANETAAKTTDDRQAYIYRVDMRHFLPDCPGSAEVETIAKLPNAAVLDGIEWLGGDFERSKLLLVSDFGLGVIYSVNIDTGAVEVAINSTYTRYNGYQVNGLKIRKQKLYFTNTGQETLVSVPINSRGETVGKYTVLAEGGFIPDDFAMDAGGDFYVTSITAGRNGIAFIPREGGNATMLAGMGGPTGAAFGRTARDRNILYVSTSGGDEAYNTGEPVTVSGKILKVAVGRTSF